MISDQEQISYMHAAKCPNLSCDYPLQIPWCEDAKLSMTPSKTDAESEKNDHDVVNDRMKNMYLSNGCEDYNNSILKCPKCSCIVSEDFIRKFKEVMEFTHEHLQNMKNHSTACILFIDYRHMI